MASIIPTVGRVVLYSLTENDAIQINQRRRDAVQKYHMHQWQRNGTQLHQGNDVNAGDVCAADIVRVFGSTPEAMVNLKVKLDGNDDYWATSRKVSDEPKPGYYHWMDYQKGQAAKTEAAEAALKLAQDPVARTDAMLKATSGG